MVSRARRNSAKQLVGVAKSLLLECETLRMQASATSNVEEQTRLLELSLVKAKTAADLGRQAKVLAGRKR